ncbi:FadR family transcriptional regulator [Corallococcus terminator]|uniref:FadR family transcriptional regulator n=2 Tax=Corallococcus terminator TaxID=2316733 RepID=A0A3A8HZ45_9BACT|nr:FadR family transcriptional regulator [Corallococcus terminator]
MERVGLVAQVEEQLERELGLGRLPRSGQLGSEQKLACRYGVSRGTVREALRRLAARGLVEQHPGRKARAVALDASLTLENLGLALHDERSPEGRRLLEGFFCLKRQVLVELLADCCVSASEADLGLLADACFRLWDAARWESGTRCAQLEFDLLRLAARVAARPGHLLLIQSMQRALRGNAARLLLLMGGESLRQWTCCAMEALRERDARALQHTLPALLKACDEQVLERFAPGLKGEAREAGPCVEERGPDCLAPAAEDIVALGGVPRLHAQALLAEPDHRALRVPAALGSNPGEPGDKSSGGRAALRLGKPVRLSDRLGRFVRGGGFQPEPLPTGFRGLTRRAVRKRDRPLHDARSHSPPTTRPVGGEPLAPPGPMPQSWVDTALRLFSCPSWSALLPLRRSACVDGPRMPPLELGFLTGFVNELLATYFRETG